MYRYAAVVRKMFGKTIGTDRTQFISRVFFFYFDWQGERGGEEEE